MALPHTAIKRVTKSGLHETPAVATMAILQAEAVPHHVWEPACGRGAIVDVLRMAGHTVQATDLNDRGWRDDNVRPQYRVDFLMEYQQRIDVECILTNPPFELQEQFVEHALFHAPTVIMLLPLTFLEGKRPCLDRPEFSRVHVFRNRLPMMHRDGWEGKKTTNMRAYGWYVWNRENKKQATMHRISWEPFAKSMIKDL